MNFFKTLFTGKKPTGGIAATNMTVRDQFAISVIAGMLADPNVKDTPQKMAAVGYLMADALLVERAK